MTGTIVDYGEWQVNLKVKRMSLTGFATIAKLFFIQMLE
jgi:hypothetical protein